mgnify:CR=1 FL=1
MADKNKVVVKIAGKDYTIVGSESDEFIQRVGLYVDKKMNEVLKNNSTLSTSMASVLTALNVAYDFFKASENETNLKEEIKSLNEEKTKLKEENKQLKVENSTLNSRSSNYQLELAKKEAELKEVRSNIEKDNKKSPKHQ